MVQILTQDLYIVQIMFLEILIILEKVCGNFHTQMQFMMILIYIVVLYQVVK